MNINRDNYEEYFLLYADNELTDYEKGEVLRFIRENKDLEKEFKMIQDTICKPEADINLQDKSFLLKDAESDFITEKNYETVFVLYHDNELTNGQKTKTDLFLIKHPQLKSEFELFGKSKLSADNSILFPEKKKLHRKEKTGKIIPLIIWRAMAAAVFIGFGFWIAQKYTTQKQIQPPVAVHIIPVKKNAAQQKTTPSLLNKKDNEVANTEKPKEKNSINEKNVEPKNVSKGKKENKNIVAASLVKTFIKNKKTAAEKQVLNIPQEKINSDVAIAPSRIKETPQVIAATKIEEPFKEGDAEQKILSNGSDQPAMQVHAASYVNDEAGKNENYVFYNITTEEFRKSKVGGFLKKVKRIVERNNPVAHLFSGDDKQVASN